MATLRRGLCILFFRYFLTAAIFVMILMTFGSLLLSGFKSTLNDCSTASDWFLENMDIAQDDPGLLRYISKYHLEPPSSRPYDQAVISQVDRSSLGPLVVAIFKKKRNGFFVEAGSFNGIQESTTLILERDFEWNGILVAGNAFVLPELQRAGRRAWIADVCLTITPYPQKVKFVYNPGEPSGVNIQGALPLRPNASKFNQERKDSFLSAGYVECFPVFSLLAALNMTTVDYFSLDVKGAELKVLENIPFDRISIKVFSVDHWTIDGGVGALDAFFASKNYSRIARKGSTAFYAQNGLLSDYELDQGIGV